MIIVHKGKGVKENMISDALCTEMEKIWVKKNHGLIFEKFIKYDLDQKSVRPMDTLLTDTFSYDSIKSSFTVVIVPCYRSSM